MSNRSDVIKLCESLYINSISTIAANKEYLLDSAEYNAGLNIRQNVFEYKTEVKDQVNKCDGLSKTEKEKILHHIDNREYKEIINYFYETKELTEYPSLATITGEDLNNIYHK
jgi:hypothetical protein